MAAGPRQRATLLGAACLAFVLLATANSGGYRFGVGDQAFYEPATRLKLSPELFPRDRELIASQGRLTIVDDVLAGTSRVTGLDLPALFLALYIAALVTLFLASHQLARVLGLSPWATAAFLGLLTLRHRIAKTGANTLEGYMHPRQIAFALGALAFAAALRRRWIWLTLSWLIAAALHPTTALWWAVFIGAGWIFSAVNRRRDAWVFVGVVVLTFGLPRIALPVEVIDVMDAAWRQVLVNKDYVFASTWPLYAWLFNLVYLPLIWLLYRVRTDAGAAHPAERRMVAGALVLFAAFCASLVFSSAGIAIAIQLQVSRVFWWLDFILALYLAWWLTSSAGATRWLGARAPQMAVATILLFSAGRGVYTLAIDQPDRSLVRVNLPGDAWTDAMRWLKAQPSDWLILAHPDHAWMYGSSVRVAASRDVVLESVKDTAIAMYSRNVAMRVAERLAALATFETMTAADLRSLGARYGATVLVVERSRALDLPHLYANADFAIYDLR